MFKYTVLNDVLIPVIRGSKGSSGSSHTPVEAKESGRSHQIMEFVEVISEGEIYGLVDDMKSVYLDKTPIVNSDGSFNFKNITIKGVVGTQDQDVLTGFSSAQREVAVGTDVKHGKPITRRVTDTSITDLRITVGVKSLLEQADNGDTNPTSVDLLIKVGDRVYPHNFTGKYSTSGGYSEMIEIGNLPTAPFNISVERVTPDSDSQRLQNSTFWASYTEIIDDGYAYPNTALMAMSIDSDYFQSQPQRNFLVRGLIVDVPDIYDPITRNYSSNFWDGNFKRAWTNNPVWIWYELVTNKRFGLAKSIAEFNVDKFQLFAIAKYCDELVPDGYGGTEPRMTCNAWITDQTQAYELIQNLSSVFRAMPIWTGQALTAVQDRASDPVWKYTNSNVVEGLFTYSSSARKARHNTIQVEWVNPDDFYNSAIEQVVDDESVRKYGQNISKVTAFGCTSRGQAYRTGRWILETERLETETVSFTVGAEGLMHLPYDIIEVADNQYAGVNIGGRVLSAIANKVELDRPIEFDNKTYLSYITKTGAMKRSKVLDFDKNTNTATLDQAVGDIQDLSIWSLETSKVVTGLYRCISIKENVDNKTFDIVALQHVPEKEDIVINGTHFDPKPRTVHTTIDGISVDYDGTKAVIRGNITNGIDNTGTEEITYDIRILKNGAVISNRLGLKSPSYSVEDLENGEYTVIITAKDSKGRILSTREYSFVIDKPPIVGNPSAVGGLGCIYLTWDYVNEITDTEIWASKTDDLSTAKQITRLNGLMYTFECGGNETWFFWLRHVRGTNIGSFGRATGIQGTSADSLDDIKQLQAKIVNEVVTVALPARKLDMTLTVDDIGNTAQYRGHKQVYNEADGKLYTWNGSKYESGATELLASAIKGKIAPEQLADIPSSKITGQLQASQIAGALSLAQIPNIPTSKLSGTIGANLFQANSIGANIIQTGAIGANHLQANSVGATQLQANSVGANAIQANAIGADQIQANSITSAKIQVGAIRANHIASGEISTDKLAVGLGGNLLYNPIFANNAENWVTGAKNSSADVVIDYRNSSTVGNWYANDTLQGENVIKMGTNAQPNTNFGWADPCYVHVKVNAGQWYIFSIYANANGFSEAKILVEKYSADSKAYLGVVAENTTPYKIGSAIKNIAGMSRYFVKFQAPDTGVVSLRFRCAGTSTILNPDCYVARPMLEEATQYSTEPSAWVNAGLTAIHGGLLKTGTVHADKLVAGSITGDKIAGNTISGDKIVGRSITTDKLNVSHLSAIASNIGSINAGDITGVNIHGNNINGNNISGGSITGTTITGTTINGTDINGGTIRGARLEGVNGTFTGTLEVNNLVGGNLCEVFVANLRYHTFTTQGQVTNTYSATIRINPSPVKRIVFIVNSDIAFIVNANEYKEYYYSKTSHGTHPPEVFGFAGGDLKISVTAYAVSDARTIYQ